MVVFVSPVRTTLELHKAFVQISRWLHPRTEIPAPLPQCPKLGQWVPLRHAVMSGARYAGAASVLALAMEGGYRTLEKPEMPAMSQGKAPKS